MIFNRDIFFPIGCALPSGLVIISHPSKTSLLYTKTYYRISTGHKFSDRNFDRLSKLRFREIKSYGPNYERRARGLVPWELNSFREQDWVSSFLSDSPFGNRQRVCLTSTVRRLRAPLTFPSPTSCHFSRPTSNHFSHSQICLNLNFFPSWILISVVNCTCFSWCIKP